MNPVNPLSQHRQALRGSCPQRATASRRLRFANKTKSVMHLNLAGRNNGENEFFQLLKSGQLFRSRQFYSTGPIRNIAARQSSTSVPHRLAA